MLSNIEYAHALDELLAFLGETYVEVSSQAEALRTVVADLQSSLACLHGVPGSSSQNQSSRLIPSAVLPQGPAEQHSFEQQPLDPSAPAPHALSPSSATPPPRIKPSAHRAPLAHAPTHHSTARNTPVRSLSSTHRFGRAQAAPTSTGAVKRGSARAADLEVGIISREVFESVRGPQPSPSPSAPPSAPSTNAPPPCGPLTRSPSARAPPSHAPLVSNLQRPGPAANAGSVTGNVPGSVQVVPKARESPEYLCCAYQHSAPPPPPHPPTTPSRPALSLGFKRALARHREALQASNALSAQGHIRAHRLHQYQHHLPQQQQQQQQQQQHGPEEGRQQMQQQQLHGSFRDSTVLCAEDAALLGAIDAVEDAAECFTKSLATYYDSAGSGSSSGSNGGSAAAGQPSPLCSTPASNANCRGGAASVAAGSPPSVAAKSLGGSVAAGVSPAIAAEGLGGNSCGSAQQHAFDNRRVVLVHNADVCHVALVAAHSWLLQAVTKAARQCSNNSSSKPGMSDAAAASSGVSPTQVLQLLHSLPELQAQLSAWHAELQQEDALSGSGRASAAAVSADAGSAFSNDPSVSAAAAAAWRNRFLRAVMAGKEQGKGYGMGTRTRSGRLVSAGPLAQRRPDSLETRSGGGSSGPGAQLSVPRPLGLWLPDACFLPLVHAKLSGTSCSSSSSNSPSHTPAPVGPLSTEFPALLAEAPWVLALPIATARAAQASTAGAAQQSTLLVPCISTLAAPSPIASVSHARSQMQLQLHLMHAWVESRLASQLLPDPSYMQQCVQLAEQHNLHSGGKVARGSGASMAVPHQLGLHAELGRALAAWRLSHVFLSKNVWNRSTYVVCQHSE